LILPKRVHEKNKKVSIFPGSVVITSIMFDVISDCDVITGIDVIAGEEVMTACLTLTSYIILTVTTMTS
jgi:hypothetical protein